MRTLIYEYKQSLRSLREMKTVIESKAELTELDLQDKTLINSMISETEFAIQWMMSGRNPVKYTAELLGITKSSVQTYLERAERKIEDRKNGSLFLIS